MKIGKKTNPIGMSVAFVTKMGNDLQDNPRAEVARFVLPIPKDSEEEEESDALDSSDDDLGEFNDIKMLFQDALE